MAALLERARVDFPAEPRPPLAASVVVAAALAVVGSLAADAALVAIGEAVFPATRGFSHFQFYDYASLTVIGVLAACGAWPVVTRVSSAPRWLFARMAVAVTVVLWLPDVYLLARGEPLDAVGVLMAMHLPVAVITYFALVGIAPAAPPLAPANLVAATPTNPVGREPTALPGNRPGATGQTETAAAGRPPPACGGGRLLGGKAVWVALISLISLDLAVGVVALVTVPISRPAGALPHRGQLVYVVHAGIGVVLSAGALWVFSAVRRQGTRIGRDLRLAATMGLVGIGAAAVGGIATAEPGGLRIVGMGLMLAGTIIAILAYVLPLMGPAQAAADRAGLGTAAEGAGTPANRRTR